MIRESMRQDAPARFAARVARPPALSPTGPDGAPPLSQEQVRTAVRRGWGYWISAMVIWALLALGSLAGLMAFGADPLIWILVSILFVALPIGAGIESWTHNRAYREASVELLPRCQVTLLGFIDNWTAMVVGDGVIELDQPTRHPVVHAWTVRRVPGADPDSCVAGDVLICDGVPIAGGVLAVRTPSGVEWVGPLSDVQVSP